MTIIKRADLGRPLTWDELDSNFEQVDSLVSEASVAVSIATTQAAAASNFADNASQSSQQAQTFAGAASTSANSAAASAATAGSAAASAVGQTVRAPSGEVLSALPAASSRQNQFIATNSSGDVALVPRSSVPLLDGAGKLSVSVLPAIALTEPFVVNSQAAMLALDAQVGDIAKRTDKGYSFCLSASPASTLSNWIQLNDDILAQLALTSGAAAIGALSLSSGSSTVQTELNKKPDSTTLAASSGATLVGALDDASSATTVQNALNLKVAIANIIGTGTGQGAKLVGVKSPLVGAIARTQFDKNNDSVTTADFGSIGDGTLHPLSERFSTLTAAQVVYPFVTSLTQSIDWAALQAALNSGKPVQVIGRLVATDKFTSSNKNVVIFTPGIAGASVKFANTTGGFDFTFKSQDTTPPQYMSIWGLDIITDVAVSTPAIRGNWGVRVPNASGQCTIENVRISSGDSTSGSFEAGIDLIYAFRVFLNKVQILGDNARTGNDAFRAQGCVEINHTDCLANRYKCPARIKKYNSSDAQTEGIWFKGCWFYDCSMGIQSPDQSIHISIIETFINPNGTTSVPISNIASIDITNCSQFVIENNVIYIGGNSTDGVNQDAVRISGSSTGGALGNNQLVAVQKANSRYGVVVSGTVLYSQFCNNKISGFTNEGINITASTCKGNVVAENALYDCGGSWIADSGTGTIKFGNTGCAALDVPYPLNPLLVNSTGLGSQGSISGDSNWGMLFYPASGSVGHIALCDSSEVAVAGVNSGRFGVKNYAKASLPSADFFGGGMSGLIAVTDDVGGHTLAFSDGTNWRRVADRAIIS